MKARQLVYRILPERLIRLARRMLARPAVGSVDFGAFRRLTPISRAYGYDRGRPIDRYYIESFLEAEARHIHGTVLEIGDSTYTRRFGSNLDRCEVLHVSAQAAGVTYVDDLTTGEQLPTNRFDCVILTQTLHLIYDIKSALATVYRILKPGGVLLVTVPGITQISDGDWNDSWYWSLTSPSAKRLCSEVFAGELVEVKVYGNVLAAMSFLHGLAESELTRQELDAADPEYPVTITIKAQKGDQRAHVPMANRWEYPEETPSPYDDTRSYELGMQFLDGHGSIEDWGCGTTYAKRFVRHSTYRGVDGSDSKFRDVAADLQCYTSEVDCIFMRHVLEHNWGWRRILANAVGSFRRRLVLVVFTPFAPSETKLLDTNGVPDLALEKGELLTYFKGLSVKEETIRSTTQYGVETLFYVEKPQTCA